MSWGRIGRTSLLFRNDESNVENEDEAPSESVMY